MSESSSDTESSCGWTIISNEGSDIETLGSENPLEDGTDGLERAPEPDLQNLATSLSAGCVEDGGDTHDDTLKEETLDETFTASEAGTEQVTLFSSSDHSDIVTLGDAARATEPEERAASEEDFYLGTSSSSQYTFNALETVFAVQQQQQQAAVLNSSSSSEEDDDTAGSSSTPVALVRRRRLRKNTVSSVTEPENDEEDEDEERLPEHEERRASSSSSSFQSQEQMEEEPFSSSSAKRRPAQQQPHRVVSSGGLNRCILLALVVATSMGFGHFYATFQIQERHKIVEQIRENEREDVRDVLLSSFQRRFIGKEVVEDLREDEDELDMVHTLSGLVESITTENQELSVKHSLLKAQRDDLLSQLKRSSEKTAAVEREQQKLAAENGLLRSSLGREQNSLSVLQDELRALRAQIAHLEARGTDAVLLENQRLKGELEEERMAFTSVQSQREAMAAKSHTLRTELDQEKRTAGQLRTELDQEKRTAGQLRTELDQERRSAGQLRTQLDDLSHGGPRFGEEEADSETVEELQARLAMAERKLSFERQRSDLWERLYVETKEERAKGDTQPKVKKAKEGMIGKVKETFDAVKNSTKEFVHHHKEQIKKAKDAVKENLRKFSDSVKSTFRHFKDSASTFMNKAKAPDRRFNQKDGSGGGGGESWQHRPHKPHHKHPPPPHRPSGHGPHNTRKSGAKVQDDGGGGGGGETHRQRAGAADPTSCSGVFDCAYQESMSLFNKAMGPVRADEFHQLLQSYLQQEVDHFRHWSELEQFVSGFFRNGVFIHDQMLFTDFVSGVEDYLEDMHEYHGLRDDLFEDLDDYVYRHFFGDGVSERHGPRPFEGPDPGGKEEEAAARKRQGCKRQQQRASAGNRQHRDNNRKWSRSSGRNTDRHMADVKIELGPMPFDPKY